MRGRDTDCNGGNLSWTTGRILKAMGERGVSRVIRLSCRYSPWGR